MDLLCWCVLWGILCGKLVIRKSKTDCTKFQQHRLKNKQQKKVKTTHETYLGSSWNNDCTQCWTRLFICTCSAEKRSLLRVWMEPHEQKCPLIAWGDWDNEEQGQRRRGNGELHCKKWSINNQKFDQKSTYLCCQICCSAYKRNRLEFWYQRGRIYAIIHCCAFGYYVRPR